ncbi:hypothetical protein ASC63_10450 [Leifsonia sp. Root112D2]|nr:hypothetical protein ASC63_10450 [Leifsonia sp. Root112D2]
MAVARESGYSGVTFEAVAKRAGVTRPTIYRRWSSKSHLLSAALHAVAPRDPVPDTGSGLDDVLMLVSRLQLTLVDTGLLGVVLELMAGSAEPGAMNEPLRRDYLLVRFQTFADICDRAVARGELAPGADPSLLRDLVLGPLAYRWLVQGELEESVIERLVTAAWLGMTGLPVVESRAGILPAIDAPRR